MILNITSLAKASIPAKSELSSFLRESERERGGGRDRQTDRDRQRNIALWPVGALSDHPLTHFEMTSRFSNGAYKYVRKLTYFKDFWQ